MSKSCCNHSHAAPIKAIGKATPHQHRHDSHCCDKVASASGCANPAPQDHQAFTTELERYLRTELSP